MKGLEILLWGAVLFLAPLAGVTLGAGPEILELGEEDCGRERDVPVGALVRLMLPEPGGTGYLWEPEQQEAALLRLLESTTVRRGPKELLGGPHDRIFLFQALAPGRTRLTLELRRPWEKAEPPLKSCSLTLNIL